MAKIVILGAGVAGHTAALILRRKLGARHPITVVTPGEYYEWIPSNIWVGIGRMTREQVRTPLAPIYQKLGIDLVRGSATVIHPDDATGQGPFVEATPTDATRDAPPIRVPYDFLINATGPKLDFEATEGLGPGGFTESVCSSHHAARAWERLSQCLDRLARGERQRFLIGVGHPTATCQGAAFEYALNVASEIRKRRLSHLAEITWITNEYELGDFGMAGAFIKRGGYITSTRVFAESFLSEHGISWIKRAGVTRVEPGRVHYTTLDGQQHSRDFDFAMLLPRFAGVGLKARDRDGNDISDSLFAPGGFMKVDADYSPRPFERWSVDDWPSTYQSPARDNIFAVGIAFAPPHPISKPMSSPDGLAIYPSPPRTGMPSGVMGKVVALNIAERILHGRTTPRHRASLGRMGAACIISSSFGMRDGMAATMTVHPIVPDYQRYPQWGRDLTCTMGEPGLAGHWIKLLLHHLFLYKAKANPLWWVIPE